MDWILRLQLMKQKSDPHLTKTESLWPDNLWRRTLVFSCTWNQTKTLALPGFLGLTCLQNSMSQFLTITYKHPPPRHWFHFSGEPWKRQNPYMLLSWGRCFPMLWAWFPKKLLLLQLTNNWNMARSSCLFQIPLLFDLPIDSSLLKQPSFLCDSTSIMPIVPFALSAPLSYTLLLDCPSVLWSLVSSQSPLHTPPTTLPRKFISMPQLWIPLYPENYWIFISSPYLPTDLWSHTVYCLDISLCRYHQQITFDVNNTELVFFPKSAVLPVFPAQWMEQQPMHCQKQKW